MKKNSTGQYVGFQMISSTDGSNVTTGSPAVYVTIDGGTQATGGGAKTHEGNGQWTYTCAQADTNGDHVVYTMVLSGAVSQAVNVYPRDYTGAALTAVPWNSAWDAEVQSEVTDALNAYDPPTKAELDSAVAPLATSSALATVDGEVGQILTDTGTTLPDTLADIQGTTFNTSTDSLEAIRDRGDAEWITATGFATSGALATVDGVVDTILLDTNELQTNQGNWLTLTGASTHSAADVWAAGTRTLTGAANITSTDAAVPITAGGLVSADMTAISTSTTAADNLEASAGTIILGTVTGTPTSTTVEATGLSFVSDDVLIGRCIVFRTGNSAGEASKIVDYDGTTKTMTVTALAVVPAASDTFVIV